MSVTIDLLKFHVRDVYGRRLFYPVNQAAMDLVAFTGKKTLHQKDIESLRKLKFQIEFVLELEAPGPKVSLDD